MHAQPSYDWLRHRASSDLRCSDVQIQDTQDANRKRVEGCERETSYARICEDGHCRWVQERPVEPLGSPPTLPKQRARSAD